MTLITITLQNSSIVPPVFVAGSFTAWEPIQMGCRSMEENSNENIEYFKSFDLQPGKYQYKFRLGLGDWWVCDDTVPLVVDERGIANNLLTIASNDLPSSKSMGSSKSKDCSLQSHYDTSAGPAGNVYLKLLEESRNSLAVRPIGVRGALPAYAHSRHSSAPNVHLLSTPHERQGHRKWKSEADDLAHAVDGEGSSGQGYDQAATTDHDHICNASLEDEIAVQVSTSPTEDALSRSADLNARKSMDRGVPNRGSAESSEPVPKQVSAFDGAGAFSVSEYNHIPQLSAHHHSQQAFSDQTSTLTNQHSSDRVLKSTETLNSWKSRQKFLMCMLACCGRRKRATLA